MRKKNSRGTPGCGPSAPLECQKLRAEKLATMGFFSSKDSLLFGSVCGDFFIVNTMDSKIDKHSSYGSFFCLFRLLPSSSTNRLYRIRAPRQSVLQFYVLPYMRQSWETMTSVSASDIILTPT